MSYLDQCDQSKIEYKGDGTQVLYTFAFTYMKKSDIYVELYNESTRKWEEQTNPTDWDFSNATTIEFTTAPSTPTGTDVFNIRIARCTDIDSMTAQFNPGSAIRAVDLNDNFEQLQLAVEEGRCQIPTSFEEFVSKEYWNKFDDTTTSTDSWNDEDDDDHIPTTKAVKSYVDSQTSGGDSGVTKIKAGTNVTISPSSGVGEVTINSTGSSSGGVVYQGTIDATTADPPSSSDAGDFYLNTVTGTVDSGWTGVAGDDIEANDRLFYDGTNWDIVAGGTQDLQSVTDVGNSTTTGASFGGKVTSEATESSDDDTTLTTKGYVDANAGVTSIIAGDGISVDQATGDVTVTATGGGGGGDSTLQDVTDNGSITTNSITVGQATADGIGAVVSPSGTLIQLRRDTPDPVLQVFSGGAATGNNTLTISANGAAVFTGTVQANTFDLDALNSLP